MGVVGLVMGLGFVLSFGYWCTDFLVIQRAMAAESQESARLVPVIAAIPKMFFPFVVILPGLIAVCVTSHALAPATASAPAAIYLATAASGDAAAVVGKIHDIRFLDVARRLRPLQVTGHAAANSLKCAAGESSD